VAAALGDIDREQDSLLILALAIQPLSVLAVLRDDLMPQPGWAIIQFFQPSHQMAGVQVPVTIMCLLLVGLVEVGNLLITALLEHLVRVMRVVTGILMETLEVVEEVLLKLVGMHKAAIVEVMAAMDQHGVMALHMLAAVLVVDKWAVALVAVVEAAREITKQALRVVQILAAALAAVLTH
jgi:hypothetical protein